MPSGTGAVGPHGREDVHSKLPDPAEALALHAHVPILTKFDAHAAQSPERIAVSDSERQWTYGELHARSNQLAHALRAGGIRPGDVVAIYAGRNALTVWALLSVLKSGAAFTMLDAQHPPARLLTQLEIAKPTALIQTAGPDLPHSLAAAGALPSYRIDLSSASGVWGSQPTTSPHVELGADLLAYIVFTSGTTGKPRAIAGSHGPLSHFVEWHVATFGLNAEDRFSALSGLAHDVFLRDLLTPFSIGASIHLPPEHTRRDPDGLVAWMAKARISIAHLTPSSGEVLALAARDGPSLEKLRWAFFGGEILRGELLVSLRRIAPASDFVNFYGATETPQAMSYFMATHATQGVVPVGRGIDGVQLLVLDATDSLAAVGEEGEICIRTRHLAIGYLDDLEGGFGLNPFTSDPTDRLYRTGDRGCYLADGNVMHLGRSDDQVKIRGYRVELQEIESVLRSCPGVRMATVVFREETATLDAYIVGDKEDGVLMRVLREQLPDYMIPARLLLLDAFPLTPNGKVDRRALTRKVDAAKSRGPGSFNDIEAIIAAVWKEVLGVDVQRTANFFELGGHSLLAARAVAKLRTGLARDVALRHLFEAPTVAELAALLDAESPEAQPASIVHAPIESGSLLSFWQESIVAWERKRSRNTTWLCPIRIRLAGALDASVLVEAVASVLERQEALRLVVDLDSTSAPHLCAARDVPLPQVDMRGASDHDAETFARERMAVATPFDGSPLIRFLLVRRADEEHVLYATWHQLLHDPSGAGLVASDILRTYAALQHYGAPPLAPLPFRYTDYVHWERARFGDAGRTQVGLARGRLDGAKPLELPIDRPREEPPATDGVLSRFALDAAASARFAQLCQSEHVTFFMGAVAIVGLMLGQWCKTEDVALAAPINTRGREDLAPLAGRFGNWVPLRVSLAGDPTIRELFARARRDATAAYAHLSVPASLVYETRDVLGHPLCRVVVNMPELDGTSERSSTKYGAITATRQYVPAFEGCRSEITILLTRRDEKLVGTIVGAANLFNATTIEDGAERLAHLFRTVELDSPISWLR